MLRKGHILSKPHWHYHQQHLDLAAFIGIVLPFFVNNPPPTHAPLFLWLYFSPMFIKYQTFLFRSISTNPTLIVIAAKSGSFRFGGCLLGFVIDVDSHPRWHLRTIFFVSKEKEKPNMTIDCNRDKHISSIMKYLCMGLIKYME